MPASCAVCSVGDVNCGEPEGSQAHTVSWVKTLGCSRNPTEKVSGGVGAVSPEGRGMLWGSSSAQTPPAGPELRELRGRSCAAPRLPPREGRGGARSCGAGAALLQGSRRERGAGGWQPSAPGWPAQGGSACGSRSRPRSGQLSQAAGWAEPTANQRDSLYHMMPAQYLSGSWLA